MPETILVVDDTKDVRELLEEFLRFEGFEVVCCENGSVALQALRASAAPPCLILLDLMMPVMDGYTFLHHQQQDAQLRNIPVLVVSAVPDLPRLPGVPVMAKPINPSALLRHVRECCTG